jgi:hypothetical protein
MSSTVGSVRRIAVSSGRESRNSSPKMSSWTVFQSAPSVPWDAWMRSSCFL